MTGNQLETFQQCIQQKHHHEYLDAHGGDIPSYIAPERQPICSSELERLPTKNPVVSADWWSRAFILHLTNLVLDFAMVL